MCFCDFEAFENLAVDLVSRDIIHALKLLSSEIPGCNIYLFIYFIILNTFTLRS